MDKNAESEQFHLIEYSALREEIVKRIELEYQIINLSLAIFALLCGAGLQYHSAVIIFLYPLLCACLAVAWVNSDTSILYIAQYIKNEIEAKHGEGGMGWEHYFEKQKKHALSTLSVLGVFTGTSISALIIGLCSVPTLNSTEIVLVALAVVSSIISAVLVWSYSSKRRNSAKKPI